MNYTAYCITNKITGKKYVGVTSRDPKIRFMEHCSHRKNLNSIVGINVNLYGKDNFELSILEENISEELRDEKERFWINRLDCLFPNGYNKATGGIKGHDLNEISRRKLSESGIGINNSKCDRYILQYDFKGNLLNKFGSAREAARYLGNEDKYRSISYALQGDTKYAYGFIWKYEE